MRNKYFSLLKKQTRKGGIFRLAGHYAGILLSAYRGRCQAGPISAELVVTWRCNERCRMCDFPARAEQGELSLEELIRLLEELKGLGVAGVSLCGGEPFLRSDLFEIARYAKKLGLLVQIPTNGLLLSPDNSEALIENAVDVVTVSLDSPDPERAAMIRGVPGIQPRVISGIKNLIAAKDRAASNLRVILSTTIMELNVGDMVPMVKLAEKLKVDGITFLPVQEVATISNRFGKEYVVALAQGFRELIALKRRGAAVIDNSIPYMDFMCRLLEGQPGSEKCFAPYTDIHIDPQGNVYPCVFWLGMKRSFGSVLGRSLKDLWYSPNYEKNRQKLAACRSCTLPCHWELSALFNKFWFQSTA